MGWEECERTTTCSIGDALFLQMVSVHSILASRGIEHAIMYGSLLGAVNFRDINPREVDNDFVVPSHFKVDETLQRDFRAKGWVVFKMGEIFRVCRSRNDSGGGDYDARPPWIARYIPYTDMYPTRFRPTFFEPTWGRKPLSDWAISHARVRDATIPAPVWNFTQKVLLLKYGRGYTDPHNKEHEDANKWKVTARRLNRKLCREGGRGRDARDA